MKEDVKNQEEKQSHWTNAYWSVVTNDKDKNLWERAA